MIRGWRLSQSALAVIRPETWQTIGERASEGHRWAPLIQLAPGKWLGVMADGNWAVGEGNRARPLREGWHVPLLPILEVPYDDWRRHLGDLRVTSPELADAVENVVQVGPLVAAAVDGEGVYWPELAVGWLERYPDIPRPFEALRRLADRSRDVPQSLRQRARSLLPAK